MWLSEPVLTNERNGVLRKEKYKLFWTTLFHTGVLFKFRKIEPLQEDLKLRDVVCHGRDILKLVRFWYHNPKKKNSTRETSLEGISIVKFIYLLKKELVNTSFANTEQIVNYSALVLPFISMIKKTYFAISDEVLTFIEFFFYCRNVYYLIRPNLSVYKHHVTVLCLRSFCETRT